MSSLRVSLLALLSVAALAVSPGWGAAPPTFDDDRMTRIQVRGIGPQVSHVVQGAKQWAKFRVRLTTDRQAYRIGDLMDIRIQADRDCFVMVYYVSSDGRTSVICPSPFSRRNRVRAGQAFRLLDNGGRKLQQQGRAGTEVLQVVATEKELDLAVLLKQKQGGAPPAPSPAVPPATSPAPSEPMTPPSPGPPTLTSGSERTYDENGNPIQAPASPPGESVAAPIPVPDPHAFVQDAETLIRGMVLERSRAIAARGVGPAASPGRGDRVFGLASVTYRVVKR